MAYERGSINRQGSYQAQPVQQSAVVSEAVDIGSTDFTATVSPDVLYVGVSGDVVCRLTGDSSDRTFKAMPVGFHQISVSVVRRTSTTATNMILCRYG